MNFNGDLKVLLNDDGHFGFQVTHLNQLDPSTVRRWHWPVELKHLWTDPNPGKAKNQRLKEATHSRQEVDRAFILVIGTLLIELCPDLSQR